MMGVLGWTPDVIDRMTLRTLIIAYEARLVDQWNHTANICSGIHNLTVLVSHLGGKSKMKAEPPIEFHPLLRHKKKKGFSITKKNFQDLRSIFASAMGGLRHSNVTVPQ
jgi:hypothetical protein